MILKRKKEEEGKPLYYLFDLKKKFVSSLYPTPIKNTYNLDFRAIGEMSFCTIKVIPEKCNINIIKTFKSIQELMSQSVKGKKR